jgi:hypothetical protein
VGVDLLVDEALEGFLDLAVLVCELHGACLLLLRLYVCVPANLDHES